MPRPRPCGKVSWTESQAKAMVLYAAYDRHNPRRQERNYYFCAGCRAWHTTSQ
jgi:hypothetical protein